MKISSFVAQVGNPWIDSALPNSALRHTYAARYQVICSRYSNPCQRSSVVSRATLVNKVRFSEDGSDFVSSLERGFTNFARNGAFAGMILSF